jgi:uncharacterized protein with FMN-binding domain
MKHIVLWCLSTVSVLVLLFGYHTSTSGPTSTTAPTVIVSGTNAPDTGSSESATPTTPDSGSSGSASSGSGSGSAGSGSSQAGASTVTGEVAATQWGPVQVELELSGDTITKVSVLQYPNGNPKDAEINSYALPILVQETVDSQSADIDMVSGATVTSDGYIQSLQSALDEARL